MSIEDDEGIQSDFTDFSDCTEWAILVDPKSNKWLITQIPPGYEIGDHPIDPQTSHLEALPPS